MDRSSDPFRLRLLAGLALALLLAAACASPLDPRVLRLRAEPAPTALPIPVDGVSASRLHSSFGAPRSSGRTHEGIDILAPRGTPVRATTHGVVTSLRRNTLGGVVVWLTGPAGWRHYYAHLDRRAHLREGQWVEAGAILGWVGNSGNAAAGPTHLHYGIYLESGRALDPYPLLTR